MLKGLRELSRHDVVRDAVESFPDSSMLTKYPEHVLLCIISECLPFRSL